MLNPMLKDRTAIVPSSGFAAPSVADHCHVPNAFAPLRFRFDVVQRQKSRPILRLRPGQAASEPIVMSQVIAMAPCEFALGLNDLRDLRRTLGVMGFSLEPWKHVVPIVSARLLSQCDNDVFALLKHTWVIVEILNDRLEWLALVRCSMVREVRFGPLYVTDPHRVMAVIPLIRAFRDVNKVVSVMSDDPDDPFFGHRDAMIDAGLSAIDAAGFE
jgi:hypothetical protein